MKGTVVWFNEKKGYGFVRGEDEIEYFVHFTGIKSDGYKTLDEGQAVTFDIDPNGARGSLAVNVVKL